MTCIPINAKLSYYCHDLHLAPTVLYQVLFFHHSYSSEGHTPKSLRGKAPPVVDLFNDTSPTQAGSPMRKENQHVNYIIYCIVTIVSW
jgi:hypothetical protein